MSQSETRALRAAVEKKQKQFGHGRFPSELRERLLAHVKERYAAGESVTKIARALGLCEQTVWSWRHEFKRARGEEAQLRQVAIVRVTPPSRDHTVIVRGPLGLVIEGLSVAEVAELWRRLA